MAEDKENNNNEMSKQRIHEFKSKIASLYAREIKNLNPPMKCQN